MDYKEFYKNELFPDIETPITDKLLKKNKWDKYVYIHAFTKENTEYYYFDGDIGRIYAKKYDGKTRTKSAMWIFNGFMMFVFHGLIKWSTLLLLKKYNGNENR